MSSSYRACIRGLGFYVPEKVLTNYDLEKMVDTTDEWIQTRTGIKERRIAAKNTPASELGAHAAQAALKDAGMSAADIDLILVATITPDMFFPSTACSVQNRIGAKCGAFDLAAACSGFPYALSVAEAYIKAGLYKNVLVIGSEVLSGFIDWKDRSTCVLFGDGAGAAVVCRSEQEGHGILASYLGADGSQGGILQIPGGGSVHPPCPESLEAGLHFLKMEGSEVFKVAVRTMEVAVREVLKPEGLSLDDVDWLVPHQANSRILQAVAERLKFPEEKVVTNVARYGNMSSASTVVALTEAVHDGKIKKGDYVVLVAFGGGLTWASTLIKW
ncbi:MAG TPA: beta-ketoacyl-ACP synthase III [Verrucomicrobiae bacterium]|jgi:3-oxoacyl-[acyl-carrier-protein] synthase-3|nr:beta-ketoacyl-ACP synthase III [Verrucomicrobiae bacterium]